MPDEKAAQTADADAGKTAEKTDVKAEVISWVKTVLFAVLFALFITRFVIVNASIPSASMEDTVMTGDRIIAFRLAYVFSQPKRFDIVVFKYPDNESVYYIKRIIGLPGETVDIKNGKVYIDGSVEPLDDGFTREPQDIEGDMRFTVPEGCYFMMGDNRNNSVDSRYWNRKFVEKKKILGEAVIRYYPLNGIKVF
jgi:signal peptidase I